MKRMENREAIEIINQYDMNFHWNDGEPIPAEQLAEAFGLAVSALEKQETAKIVVGKSRGGVTLWHECSKCGEPVDAKDTYCSGCGRKLIYENE